MVSLRQESFGEEEETRTLKPFVETLRVRIPPGKAGPAARSESCVVMGQPILRSVDSQVKGRVIEPRKYKTRGAFVVDTGGGRVRQLTLGPLSLPDPAGVEEHGQWPPGSPRNLRDPDVSIDIPDEETGTPDLLAPGGSPTTEGSEQRAKRWYRLVKNSKRAEMDGGESERPIVSLKRGNHPRDPVEKRGRHVMTPLERHMAGASKPITVDTKQQRSQRRVRDGALIHSGSRPVASS